jgi:fatty acid desaturase 6
MFLAPFTLPALIPLVALHQLVSVRAWKDLVLFLVMAPTGMMFHLALLTHVSGYTLTGALTAMYVYRGALAVPYIHINIFQHIGLPMYSPDDRPARIYQMSTGCLNLSPNPLFNFAFGHSLISCHVEHHLFPHLSDNMCLRVKPLVRRYLKDNNLPYNEQKYLDRLGVFLTDFNSLMRDAPAITHFMGLQ